MSDAKEALQDVIGELSRDELMSALFGQLVIQNTNMALIFLGQAPHPETGERTRDLEAARFFIDTLEMLALRTKGNLTREEDKLLQQSLTHLRLSFVQAVENPPKDEAKPPTEVPQTAEAAAPAADASANPVQEEPRKRFSKKF